MKEWKDRQDEFEAILKDLLEKSSERREIPEKCAIQIDSSNENQIYTDNEISEIGAELIRIF